MILWLAPMDGITDCPYRLIVQDIFARYKRSEDHLFTWTEFMSADGYMINPSRLVKHLITTSTEPHLIAQIYGGNRDTLITTAIDIEQKYPSFAGIELNIWCPSPKVMSCGWWAYMMKHKQETLETIRAISQSIPSLPFSIKTRSGLNAQDTSDQFDFLVAASEYCHTITVHGRTFTQWHGWTVDRDYIYRLREAMNPHCVLIGNGGITSYADALERYWNARLPDEKSTTFGIMIGQSAIGNPWIFTPHTPSNEERLQTSLDHLYLMTAYEVYLDHTRTLFPEESDQLALNRKHLHMIKKYNPDSDERSDLPTLDRHEYLFPMPTRQLLDEYVAIIRHWIDQQTSVLDFGGFDRDIRHLRTGIDIRKYLFNYIAGMANNKIIKQQVISTKDVSTLVSILQHSL